MPPLDLWQALRKQPFAPFRIQVSDGSSYEVRHPELVMVGFGSAIIGLPAPNQTQPWYAGYEIVDLNHIVKLIPIQPVSVPGNGQGQ